MRMKYLVRLSVVTAMLALLAIVVIAGSRKPFTRNQPTVFVVSPTDLGPNQNAEFAVTLDGPASEDVLLTIGCTDSSAFVDLPPYVIVPYGQTSVNFTATTSSTYTSWAIVAATANGGTVLAASE